MSETIIASIKLHRKDKKDRFVEVKIQQPYEEADEDSEWTCIATITGLSNKDITVHGKGVDSLQALCMLLKVVRAHLEGLEGRVFYASEDLSEAFRTKTTFGW